MTNKIPSGLFECIRCEALKVRSAMNGKLCGDCKFELNYMHWVHEEIIEGKVCYVKNPFNYTEDLFGRTVKPPFPKMPRGYHTRRPHP